MNRANFLYVFEQLIQEMYFHCEWAIEWRENQRLIELIFQMELDNPNELPFRDFDDVSTSNEVIMYTAKIVIYDKSITKLKSSNYLVAIPVGFDEGLDYGECLAIIKYLKNLTSSVNVKWLDFINNSTSTDFAIQWNDKEYQQIKDRLIESNRYSETTIYFPRNNDN